MDENGKLFKRRNVSHTYVWPVERLRDPPEGRLLVKHYVENPVWKYWNYTLPTYVMIKNRQTFEEQYEKYRTLDVDAKIAENALDSFEAALFPSEVCEPVFNPKIKPYCQWNDFPLDVIYTDYKTLAIYHSCISYGLYTSEQLWVLSAKPLNPDANPEEYRDVVERAKTIVKQTLPSF